MNTAMICLGANTPDAFSRLSEAEDFVLSLGGDYALSGTYRTAPEYAGSSEPYLNEIIRLSTQFSLEELKERTKSYESAVRAVLPSWWEGLVNLDIDIVEWNGKVVRMADATSAYYRTGLSLMQE